MKTTSKFDDLNDTFNVTDDVVQPEVIEKKQIKLNLLDDIKKIMTIQEETYTLLLKRTRSTNGVLEL